VHLVEYLVIKGLDFRKKDLLSDRPIAVSLITNITGCYNSFQYYVARGTIR